MNFLIKDWAKISLTSYTVWAIYVLAILVNASDMIFIITGIDTNPRVWTFWINIGLVLTFVGRFIKQPKENHKRRKFIVYGLIFVLIAIAAPALAKNSQYNHDGSSDSFDDIAFDFISVSEGKNKSGKFHVSYFDTIAKPPLWTVCYGHTRTAKARQYKTEAQCRDLLIEEIAEYRSGLHTHYFTAQTKRDRLPVFRDVAFTSLAYNVGIRAAGRSTATRRLNAGNITGACNAITWWNKAGGRVVRGLVRRRSKERQYCLRG